ncbi:DUF6531 domain-containing protein [Streptomyces sp. bgisy100]|uniref:DUF6531 domain-containing protein n=1 Tax=Streptomyces sp. bgisy100 TaxID=3413783 RepID=UPI003D748D46
MGGHRPTDWHVLDLDGDPVPGDPDRVRHLARELHEFAEDVGTALRGIRNMSAEDAVQKWSGRSAKKFKEAFDGVPGNLRKLRTSYEMAGDAIAAYWPKLERAQALSIRALAKGREARADLTEAQGRLDSSTDWVKTATAKTKAYDDAKGPEAPDESKVRAATRNAQQAASARRDAQGTVDTAQSALDAAKAMAQEAKELRQEAARVCKDKLEEASDAGIQNRHWWEEVTDFVSDNWDTIVSVCKVVVAVVGIVAMVIGGPILAAIVVVAALVVLADTLNKYRKGQAGLFDVAMAALDCIPGAKGFTSLGRLAKGAKALNKTGLKGMALGVKGMGKNVRGLGREAKSLVCRTDPIDMATGEMVMSATDLELPGVLPLALQRHHRTSVRSGRWFGPTWASTLDQRLLLDASGLRFFTEDGMELHYPVPEPDLSVLPVEGPRWPLTWDGAAQGTLTVHRPDTGQTLAFRPQPNNPAHELSLAEIRDRHGNTVAVHYQPDGTPGEIVHQGGYRIGVTTESGRVTALTLLSAPDRPTLLRYAYDARGNLTGVYNSADRPLTFVYDEAGRITGWQDRNDVWYRYTYEDGCCVATEGADGFLSSSIVYDTESRRTLFTDALGNTTVYEFNDSYQMIRERDPLGNETLRTQDRYDRITSVTDPVGLTTRYTYDEAGHPTAVIRADGYRSTAENGEFGRPVTVTEADGSVWRMEYDSCGELTLETDPTGGRVSYRYDDIGAVTAITDAADRTVLMETDAAGMPIAVTDAEGATRRLERDPMGRLIAQTEPDGSVTRFAWTPEGKLSRRTLPDGTTERWTYDGEGNLVEHTDGTGQTTRFEYTGFDLPAARTDPDGSRLEFTYDRELRVTSVTNQLGRSWQYEYDAVGRLSRERDFGGRTQSYRHDAAGRLVERTNGAGESTVYVRDTLGKVLEQRTTEGVTTYAYDPVGNVRTVRSPHAELSYERDPLGRVLAETCNGATVRSAYDVLGRRMHRVTPTGAESRWEYDGRDRPVTLRTAGRSVSFAYDDAGREVERRAGDAVLHQTWDARNRLTSQTLTASGGPTAGPAPEPVQRRTYAYGPDGTVAAIGDRLTGDRAYRTDHAGRITHVQAATWSERYAYDAAGNLAQGEPSGDGAEPSATDALPMRSPGNVRYEYDAQGRVVQRRKKRLSRKPEVWHYVWDSEDRLVGVTTPDGTRWRYTYDPFGRRIAKQRLGADGLTVVEEVRFTWDGFVMAEQVTRTGDEPPRCTVWDWERDRFSPVTQVDRIPAKDRPQEWVDEQFYAIVTDVVGTPAELVDDTGTVAWHARTTVWGSPLDAGSGSGEAYCPLRFPGQYHDPETGLNYNYQRHYDPDTGQYASLDPLGLAPGPNPRSYVSNPFSAVDPLGLAPDCERALQGARDRADNEALKPGANKHNRPTSSAGLVVPGHRQAFTGANMKGGGYHDLHPRVQAAYDNVPAKTKELTGGQHSRCGEAEALSNALNAGVEPRGGVMAAVEVRPPGNGKLGAPKEICGSCQDVLNQFEITAVT